MEKANQNVLCVVKVLWEGSVYSSHLCGEASGALGDRYVDFDKLTSIEKTACVLESELWEYDFDDLLSLVKEYVVGIKKTLYGDDSCQLVCSLG